MHENTVWTLVILGIGGLFTGYMSQRGGFKVLFDFSKDSAKKYAGGMKADILISGCIALILFVAAWFINQHMHPLLMLGFLILVAVGFYFTGQLVANEQKRYEKEP